MQKYDLQKKIFLKKPQQSFKIFITLITNLKFPTQAKISSFQNPHTENRSIYYLGAQISEATILYNEFKHNILKALVGKANKQQRLGGY
jgi:hypothetical protein